MALQALITSIAAFIISLSYCLMAIHQRHEAEKETGTKPEITFTFAIMYYVIKISFISTIGSLIWLIWE